MAIAKIADDIYGPKMYQVRARSALPILVRQAHANNPITYSSLARELGMPNPRNLNYVLGSIGVTLEALSSELSLDIPLIQALVINKNTGLPGEGISPFFKAESQYKNLSRKQKIAIQKAMLGEIYTFDSWELVLKSCGLKPYELTLKDILSELPTFIRGGEGEAHQRLKIYVSENPWIISLPNQCAPGDTERSLPSGDSVDVFFEHEGIRIGVEVKSAQSGLNDIARGVFQCIKYQAVMEAELISEGVIPYVRTVLVLESEMPEILIPLCHSLNVEYLDEIVVV